MNATDPVICFFLFGLIAGALKSELRLPSQVYDFVSMLLLLTIGLKGGIELANQPFNTLLPQIVAVAYINSHGIAFEEHMALFVVLLEIPAILIGIVLAKGLSRHTQWSNVAHEVLLGKGVMFLIGGLVIGWRSGPSGVESISPLFFDLFKGILALFLLEMGLIAATRLDSLKRYGLFLFAFRRAGLHDN